MTDRVVDDTLHMAEVLRTLAAQVTAEEFGWQEANYSRDSELGRELVYLIANNEWVRATSEFIDVTRSDMVETTVKIDVDLDCITHEAFRNRTGRLWLPVFVLPPLCEHGRRLPEPDPFGTMTVTSASGKLLPTLPGAEVRHRISAALAEIIVNMAATRLAKTADTLPTATRDHRLVLSAAIYRLLRQWPSAQPAQTAFESGQQPEATSGVSRLSSARQELDTLLNSYVNPASQTAMTSDGTGSPAASEAAGTASGPGQQQDGTQAVRLLAERAVKVLRAFAESAVVVVAVPSDPTPIVLTLTLPSRPLHPGPRDQVTRKWSRPRTWRWLHWRTWNWVLPRAQIQVDLLLPSADADRQIRVDLPEGVSCDPSRPATSPAEMEIKVSQPPPFQHLRRLMDQLLEKPDRPAPLQKSVADLAAVMADAASESMRDHRVEPAPGVAGRPPIDDGSRTATFCKKLKWLRQMLDEVSEASGAEADIGRADALGADGERADAGADHALLTVRGKVAEAWDGGKWLGEPLLRCTSVDSLGPRTVLAKAGMIEDVSKRGAPTDAKIHIHVAVTDAEYFSIARFTSRMSSLLMAVVFGFFLVTQLLGWENSQVSPEVLAFVLTLFSAIQAGRIERADRTTMHGLLSGAGSFLIVASVLPSVILAVALAFSRSGLWPIGWAAGAIGLQIVVQQLLRIRGIWEHALTSDSASPVAGGLSLQTEPPNYDHGEVLHSGWWRGATANALMIGRPAYGYMIWQHDSPATLRDLLSSASPEPAAQPPTDTQAGALSRLLSKALQRTEASDPEGIQGSGSALSLDLPAGPGDLSEIVQRTRAFSRCSDRAPPASLSRSWYSERNRRENGSGTQAPAPWSSTLNSWRRSRMASPASRSSPACGEISACCLSPITRSASSSG